MSKEKIEVEVSSSARKITQALAKLTQVAKAQLKDGFQPVSDVPAIGIEAFNDLMVAVAEAKNVKADVAEDVMAFVRGATNGAVDIAQAALS